MVIPSGENLNGWKKFRELILNFLNGMDSSSPEQREERKSVEQSGGKGLDSRSFAEIVTTSSEQKVLGKALSGTMGETGEVRKLSWDDIVVVTCRDFHDDGEEFLISCKNNWKPPLSSTLSSHIWLF